MAKKRTPKATGKRLVIVESPAKAKTINKYLGDDFVVKASMGHVRDLPSKGMGVDLKTFVPDYEVVPSRVKVIKELKQLARQSGEVFLATDLDREGEAIAWHLKEALGIPDDQAKRVIFNAITKAEIQKAFAHPHAINQDRVNAQQARRILDRIVGYEISPLLWRKVARGLSAGRVQSVAARLVVERERAIEAFSPEEFWKIEGIFTTSIAKATTLAEAWRKYNDGSEDRTRHDKDQWLRSHDAFSAEIIEVNGAKFDASNTDQARAVAEGLGLRSIGTESVDSPEGKGAARTITKISGLIDQCPPLTIRSIETKRQNSRPTAPFITSTLQQAASSRLGMGAQQTMRGAQSLYEAGHITYMRTDSTHLSADALTMVRGFVGKTYGSEYLPEKPVIYQSSNKSAQEAHEAIRPTALDLTPEVAREKLSPAESKLYQLIWNKFVSCQMSPAVFDQTTVQLQIPLKDSFGAGATAVFKASGRKLVFDGFMRVAGITSEDQILPAMHEGQQARAIEINPTQHFTQPPPRFTEASLVKELEKLGIGRPSTYASIIQTIQDRLYVEQIDRRFHATMLGSVVTAKLIQAFPEIMEVNFTADMESKLDKIEEQHLDWVSLLQDFYGPFHATVDGALEKIEHAGGAPSPYTCDKCGSPMVYRISSNGFFLACTNREQCSATRPVDRQGKPTVREVSQHKCPVCGREMIKRRGRFGDFLGCAGYSITGDDGEKACTVIINLDKEGNPLPPKPKPIATTIACEKCGSPMVLRDSKRGPFLGCSSFPKCRSTKMFAKLEGANKQQVEALIPLLKEGTAKAREMIDSVLSQNPSATPAAKSAHGTTTDIDCEECGKPMTIRKGRRGYFLGCSGYPKCRQTSEVPAKLVEEMGLNGDASAEGTAAKNSAMAKPDIGDDE